MTKNTKEKPIIFSGLMVRAILEGRKTQTRHIISPKHLSFVENITGEYLSGNWKKLPLPYGMVGDRLWVREQWCGACGENGLLWNEDGNTYKVWYRATNPDVVAVDDDGFTKFRRDGLEASPWKSPLHMPRWASRITLEITGIRVERLNDISEADAIAEGAQKFDSLPPLHPFGQDCRWSMENPTSTDNSLGSARTAFANYWIKLGNPWSVNPWVWVIEFRRIE